MYLAKNLKYLRLKNGFSQEYIADKFGYKSYTTVQKWESGINEPSVSTLNDLANLYKVDMHDVYTVDLENPYMAVAEAPTEYDVSNKQIPILGTIAAGIPLLAEENREDHFNLDSRIKADFALRIKGDSMVDAGIFQDDIVFIRQQSTLENGEIGAVQIEEMETEATLKRFYKDDKSITLLSENTNYPPKTFTNGNIKILGKLVAVLNIRE